MCTSAVEKETLTTEEQTVQITITKEIASMQLCCNDDATIPVFNFVHLNAARKRFEATDGHILSIIPCVDPSEDIPENVMIRFGKVAGKLRKPGTLDTNTGVLTTSKGERILVEIAPKTEHQYPDIETVLPKSERVYRVGLSVNDLAQLAKSLSTAKSGGLVFLEFGGESSGLGAVRVTSADTTSEKHGIIMPCPHREKPLGLLVKRATNA